MASGPAVRDAGPDDADAIAAIYAESVEAGDCTMDEVAKTVPQVRDQIAALGPREALVVLEEDGRILGWGSLLRYSDRAGYRFAAETAVYLRRELRRRGLGSRVKRALIERARALGYHHLVAKVMADNEASLQYNRRAGYEVVGIQKQVGWRDGKWRDVAILQLVLPGSAPSS